MENLIYKPGNKWSKPEDKIKFLGLKDCTLCGFSSIEDKRRFYYDG